MSKLLINRSTRIRLEYAVDSCDGTEEDIEYLSTGKNFSAIRLLRTGAAKLVMVADGSVVPTTPTNDDKWTIDDEGNVRFTLVSTGFTRKQWREHLERRGFVLERWTMNPLFCSAKDVPVETQAGTTHEVLLRPGSRMGEGNCTREKISSQANENGWITPHWEIACLIRDTFTDKQLKQMGLRRIVTMHEPFKDYRGNPHMLITSRDAKGNDLCLEYVEPGEVLHKSDGFAFVLSQVGPQT